MKKLNSRGFAHWIVPAIVVLIIGAIGGYIYLRSSSAATTSLSGLQCQLLGRPYASPTCKDGCVSGAGAYVTSAPTYNYCSGAVSHSLQGSACTNLGRRLTVGGNGCARRWQQTSARPAIQCIDSTATYTVRSTTDICSGGGSSSSGGSTGSSFVGRDGFSSGNCVDYVSYILARHSSNYRGGALGNGKDVASTLGSKYRYTVNHTPKIHATVSFPGGPSGSGLGDATYGHVALVAQINGDGSIVVEESNWSVYYHYGTHTVPASIVSRLTYAHTEAGWH
ncbi:MAG: CHAP domain-containing protein [Candidatus Saccharimonadales bacterium]